MKNGITELNNRQCSRRCYIDCRINEFSIRKISELNWAKLQGVHNLILNHMIILHRQSTNISNLETLYQWLRKIMEICCLITVYDPIKHCHIIRTMDVSSYMQVERRNNGTPALRQNSGKCSAVDTVRIEMEFAALYILP